MMDIQKSRKALTITFFIILLTVMTACANNKELGIDDFKEKIVANSKDQIKQFRIYFVDNKVVWMSFP